MNAAKKEVMRDGEIDEAMGGNQEDETGKGGRNAPILYTAREAAAFCMISESNWYKLNRQGNVPKPVRIGTMYRWRKSDLVDWVAAGCPRDWESVE